MRRLDVARASLGAALLLWLCVMPPSWAERPNAAKSAAGLHAELLADKSVCPLPVVMQGAAKRAQELLGSVERFSAKDWLQEEIANTAEFHRSFTDTYDYVAEIEHPAPNQLVIRELRHSGNNVPMPEGFAIADGLPAIGLIFSDQYSPDYLFQCDGASEQHGKAAWKVSFKQRQDREPRIWSWTVGGRSYNVQLDGHAWIAADSYELLRVDADLVRPPPELGLDSAHIAIEYAPVNFVQRHEQLWLIASAEIVSRWAAGNQVTERHEFSHFTLFSVEVDTKTGVPHL